eukprot:gene6445-298_t
MLAAAAVGYARTLLLDESCEVDGSEVEGEGERREVEDLDLDTEEVESEREGDVEKEKMKKKADGCKLKTVDELDRKQVRLEFGLEIRRGEKEQEKEEQQQEEEQEDEEKQQLLQLELQQQEKRYQEEQQKNRLINVAVVGEVETIRDKKELTITQTQDDCGIVIEGQRDVLPQKKRKPMGLTQQNGCAIQGATQASERTSKEAQAPAIDEMMESTIVCSILKSVKKETDVSLLGCSIGCDRSRWCRHHFLAACDNQLRSYNHVSNHPGPIFSLLHGLRSQRSSTSNSLTNDKVVPEECHHLPSDIHIDCKNKRNCIYKNRNGSFEFAQVYPAVTEGLAQQLYDVLLGLPDVSWSLETTRPTEQSMRFYRLKDSQYELNSPTTLDVREEPVLQQTDVKQPVIQLSKLLQQLREQLENLFHLASHHERLILNVSKYTQGCFLSPHRDEDAQCHSFKRRRAIILYLVKQDYSANDGGLLVDHDTNEYIIPRHNLLVHFPVPRMHSVTPVNATTFPRFAVYGWIITPRFYIAHQPLTQPVDSDIASPLLSQQSLIASYKCHIRRSIVSAQQHMNYENQDHQPVDTNHITELPITVTVRTQTKENIAAMARLPFTPVWASLQELRIHHRYSANLRMEGARNYSEANPCSHVSLDSLSWETDDRIDLLGHISPSRLNRMCLGDIMSFVFELSESEEICVTTWFHEGKENTRSSSPAANCSFPSSPLSEGDLDDTRDRDKQSLGIQYRCPLKNIQEGITTSAWLSRLSALRTLCENIYHRQTISGRNPLVNSDSGSEKKFTLAAELSVPCRNWSNFFSTTPSQDDREDAIESNGFERTRNYFLPALSRSMLQFVLSFGGDAQINATSMGDVLDNPKRYLINSLVRPLKLYMSIQESEHPDPPSLSQIPDTCQLVLVDE